jgi:hypothetical protein
MNPQFEAWFSQGKVAEALSGVGDYFIPDVTYRDDHDFGLALYSLMDWAKSGRIQEAAQGFQMALDELVRKSDLRSALLLLRSYALVREDRGSSLPLNEDHIASRIGHAVVGTAQQLARDEELRTSCCR